EACKLKVPYLGSFQTTSGSILKATTTCRLAPKAFNSSRKVSSFKLVGCKMFNPWDLAYVFTALSLSFRPLPAGLSGAVMTPTTWYLFSMMLFKMETANSGVPINTILKSVMMFVVCRYFYLLNLSIDVPKAAEWFFLKHFQSSLIVLKVPWN